MNLFERGLLDEEFPDDEDPDDPYLGERLRVVERVDATDMHQVGVLSGLTAAIKRAPVTRDLVKETMVWPYGTAPDPYEVEAPADSPWATGPWASLFDVNVRDTLASVSDTDIAAVAARWGDTDTMREFGAGAGALEGIVTRLVGFAKEARDDGEQLFSWVCL